MGLRMLSVRAVRLEPYALMQTCFPAQHSLSGLRVAPGRERVAAEDAKDWAFSRSWEYEMVELMHFFIDDLFPEATLRCVVDRLAETTPQKCS